MNGGRCGGGTDGWRVRRRHVVRGIDNTCQRILIVIENINSIRGIDNIERPGNNTNRPEAKIILDNTR